MGPFVRHSSHGRVTQILVSVLTLVSWVAWHILVASQTSDLAAYELYEGRITVLR